MMIPDPKFKKGDKVNVKFEPVGVMRDVQLMAVIQHLESFDHGAQTHRYGINYTKKEQWTKFVFEQYDEVYETQMELRK